MTRNASETSDWNLATLESPVDGIDIRYARWEPQPSAFGVLLLNGRMEWIEKYGPLPAEIKLSQPVCWATMDHRGQGASGGPKAHVRSYDEYTRDVGAVAQQVFGDRPYAVIAHSMGGLIAMHGCLHGHLRPRSMSLCSPLFALPDRPVPRRLAEPLAALIRRTRWQAQPTGVRKERRSSFHRNPLTHSQQAFERAMQSPFLYVSPTFGWVAATFDACREIFDETRILQLSCPVQIFSGTEESIVDPRAYPLWCERASALQHHPVQYRLVTDGRHELLNEIPRIKSQVLSSIVHSLERFLVSKSTVDCDEP
jgi:lysophospholipase